MEVLQQIDTIRILNIIEPQGKLISGGEYMNEKLSATTVQPGDENFADQNENEDFEGEGEEDFDWTSYEARNKRSAIFDESNGVTNDLETTK